MYHAQRACIREYNTNRPHSTLDYRFHTYEASACAFELFAFRFQTPQPVSDFARNNCEPDCSCALSFAGCRRTRQKLFHLIDFVSRFDQQAHCDFSLFVLLSLDRPNHNLSHAIE
jgi:hypothetical protein